VQLKLRVAVTTVAAVFTQHVPLDVTASDVRADKDTPVTDIPAQVRIN